MKHISLLFWLCISCFIHAQDIIEPCKFGQPLIEALQAIYTPDNPLGYGDGRDILYSEIDNEGLELSGVYTQFTVTLDPNQDPSVSAFQGGAGLNAEHVYPQSKGAGDEPARSDLHNIFPCKVNVNEARGSCPFGEIDDEDTDRWFYLQFQTSNLPNSDIDLYSEKDEEDCVFEPREAVKGDIARAVFYFYTIYQSIADSRDPNFFHPQKDILYQWHLSDPPDERELYRNQRIAEEQGNLNPFISDTSLVKRAYFSPDASYPVNDANCYTIETFIGGNERPKWVNLPSNVVQDELLIFSTKPYGQVLLFDLSGQLVEKTDLYLETQLKTNHLSQGMYILQVYAENEAAFFKVLKK